MLFHPDHILHFKKNCNFPNYYKRIRFCLEVLKLKKESRLVINTNADRSEYKKNPKISLERGEIVKEIFVFYGIEPERISIVDNADKHPLGDNQTAEGQRMNRRVELRIPNYL
jgi:outer membrane protein OmpA-like peptidoglycan-associated protein